MNIIQDYLSLYQELSDPKKSAQANATLIKIQQNQQSWQLARQLLNMPSQNTGYSHGCQLLSKKLNRPYTADHQKRLNLFSLIYSQPKLNQTLYYCLAKLCLHLDLQQIRMDGSHCTPETLISILSWIPEASKMITVAPLIVGVENAEKIKVNREYDLSLAYFDKYKKYLAQYFPNYTNRIITCIDNFISNTYKLNDQNLLSLLLTQKIDKVSTILEIVLQNQKYPQLNQQIYQYLLSNGLNSEKNNEQMEDIVLVYISFCSNLELLELSPEFLYQILKKILDFMRKQLFENDESTYAILESSFKFWSHVISILNKKQNHKQQRSVCYQALLETWKILIQKSLLNELPQFKREETDPLVISLDEDDEDGLCIQARIQVVGKFRNLAEDYMLLVYNSLACNEEYRIRSLKLVFDLTTSGNPLDLELSIFVLSCIIEMGKSDGVESIGQIIESIISHEHAKIPYIWQELIKLISKFGNETTSNTKVLQLTLLVLKESIVIPQLCSLTAQTFNSVVSSCQESSEKATLTPILQQFIKIIYPTFLQILSSLFTQPNTKYTQNAFESLIKSIIIFIYSMMKDQNYFYEFLSSIKSKIIQSSEQAESQSAYHDKQIQIAYYIAIAHNFVSHQYSAPFIPIVSNFMVQFIPVLQNSLLELANNQYHKNREKHKLLMKKLGFILGVVCGFNSLRWAQFIAQITIHAVNLKIEKQDQWKKTFPRYIELCVAFLKIQQYDANQYPEASLKFLNATYPLVHQLMEEVSDKQHDLILQILNYHFQLINKHLQKIPQYSPHQLFVFIKTNLIQNQKFWEYAIFRKALAILRLFIEKKYEVELILFTIISQYRRLSDCFWKSLENILVEAYRVCGIQIFKEVFKNLHPSLMPPNPLFGSFEDGLAKQDSKTLKMILENLN